MSLFRNASLTEKLDFLIQTLQENYQAFRLIVDTSLSLLEAFSFPITTVPLLIAFPEGKLG